MEQVIAGIIASLLFPAIVGVVGMVRAGGARGRRAARGRVEHVPVRLRGIALRYPGFWRAGRLELETGVWRPRGGWGPVVRLSGASVHSRGVGDESDGLPPLAAGDALLTGVDGHGRLFQLATVDGDDAYLIDRRLRKLTKVGADSANTPLRWVQHRVPLTVMVVSAVVVLWLVFWWVPLLGARQVTAEVVENRGPEYLCEVAWTGGHDYATCGDEQPGERVDITVVGWPRTGAAEDPETALIMGGVGLTLLVIPTVMVGKTAAQRRRLRTLEREHAA